MLEGEVKMSDHTDNAYPIEPGQEWEIDLFKPEDAPGVRQLFLSIYGEGYPIRAYLEPERLIAENAAGTIISSVARTAGGDIVGHDALYQSAPCKKIYEAGAGLVHRNYRGGKGIFEALVCHGIKIGALRFNVEAIFGEAVCNHVFSQKMDQKIGAVTCAIEVDLMPASAYTAERSAKGRVASLFDFINIKSMPHSVYIPAYFEEPIRYIYAGLNDSRNIYRSVGKPAADAQTQIDVEYFEFAQVARIAIARVGLDFEEMFLLREQELLGRGAAVLQASLNLSEP
jgi:hypothetical protein